MIRLAGYLVSVLFTGVLLAASGVWIAISAIEPDLPDFAGLADYEPRYCRAFMPRQESRSLNSQSNPESFFR